MCYGTLNVLAKSVMTDYHIQPFVIASIAIFFGGIILAPLVAQEVPRTFQSSKRAVAMFALSGVGAGTGVVALYSSLERAEVVVVTPIVAISPLITIVLARLFLNKLENITPPVILGTFLVVGGTGLVIVGNSF
jgi:drug/metabolite transporter (DMT)-like permease